MRTACARGDMGSMPTNKDTLEIVADMLSHASLHGIGPRDKERIENAIVAAREEGRMAAFRFALEYHAEECRRCGGPDDGCEFGQWLEIRTLGKDADTQAKPAA